MRSSLFALQGPMIVARELGFFRAEGLPDPEYLPAGSSTRQTADLLGGRIDVAVTAADNVIGLQLEGRPVRIFHVADLGIDQYAVAGRGIADWADVRGRAIGVDSATSGYAYVLYRLLEDHGISRSDVEIVELGGPDGRLPALVDGAVAVGLLNPGMTARARQAGLGVLGAAADRFPEYPNLVFAATEARLDAEPASYAAYARAIDAAVRWVDDPEHAELASELIGRERGLDLDAARRLHAEERRLRRVTAPDGAATRRGLAVVAELREEYAGVSLPPESFATPGLLARGAS